MKNLILPIVVLLFCIGLNAQERYFDERYISSQSFINPVLVNPGATGNGEFHEVLASYKNKWASFEDSPRSFLLSYNGPVGNRLGFGAMLLTDAAGALETTKGQISFSYTIDSPTNVVGFGISTEYISHGISNSVLSNPLLDNTDSYLLDRLGGADYFDASFGIFGRYDDKIMYGVSFPSLLNSRLEDRIGADDERDFGYILNLGYRWIPVGSDMVIEPSIWAKSLNNVPTHFDVNVLMRFLQEKFYGGLTYRVGADETVGFTLGARVNAFNFFYTYNTSRHDFQTYNNGSHDLTVRFDIGRRDEAVTIPTDNMEMKTMDEEETEDMKAKKEIMKGTKKFKN